MRRVVTEGTASLADVKGYNVGGKTGTALIVENGKYTKKKINTFASIFPTNEPEYVLIIMLEDTKLSKDYVYKYRNKPGSFVGTPFNTAGWTSVEVAAKIIENTQRDVNIALINELSMIFNKMDINTYEVLEAAGTKWNFLKFQPGLVGGHCIGVDPYYLTHKANNPIKK